MKQMHTDEQERSMHISLRQVLRDVEPSYGNGDVKKRLSPCFYARVDDTCKARDGQT